MDPAEEQKQELEILESIYPDELKKINDKEFTIRILLDTESEKKHSVLLHVKYPDNYPEVMPDLDVLVGGNAINLSETIFFDDDDTQLLLNKVIEEAAQNVGMPSIFALTSSLKDEAEILFQDKLNKAQKEYDEMIYKKELEAQKKFIGTKVTPESFKAWREKFRKEMKIDEKLANRFNEIHQGKMTGKEIFEKGLAKGVDEDVNSGDVPSLEKGVEKLEI
ncbi:hypothetical protein PACTADRAFT_37847 [Pachysolen tannophilus NRRL Y-2460]|uniref:RWD domain-containing protein n=1 Tax=Pachysolen tannophilus NRRL Y-2460 TaxID=669874 RepID=A0A1E4U292_PACTA|nr:hypothetical protein PACTADRAFT_37847 [Pachysolen tannophilus NRRL Y-2460]